MSIDVVLERAADELEQALIAQYPAEAAWFNLVIHVQPVWGGGYDVLGVLYATPEAAQEAQRAAVMQQLLALRGRQ